MKNNNIDGEETESFYSKGNSLDNDIIRCWPLFKADLLRRNGFKNTTIGNPEISENASQSIRFEIRSSDGKAKRLTIPLSFQDTLASYDMPLDGVQYPDIIETKKNREKLLKILEESLAQQNWETTQTD